MYRTWPSLTTSSNSPFRRQNATNSWKVSSSSAMRSTNCNISGSPRRMAMAKTSSSRVRAKASCRKIDSRVPIFAARWSSLTFPHSSGANSSRMASPTSLRVIVPSKSVRTASLDGIAPFALRLPGSRPFAPGVEVRPLLLRQAIDPDAEALEAQPSDLQIEVRGHRIDAGFELRGVCRQVARGDGLDRETHVHDLHRVALACGDVQEAALGDQVDPFASWEHVLVDVFADLSLRLREPLQVGFRDLVVEVSGISQDHGILETGEVRGRDDVLASGCRDDEVRDLGRLLHGEDLEPVHCGLDRLHRIDFRHDDPGAHS